MGGEQETSLRARLIERQRKQLEDVEKVTQEQLTQLAESLTQHVGDVLGTTKVDISQQSHEIREVKQVEVTTSHMNQRLSMLSRLPDEELAQVAKRLSYDLRKAHKHAISESVTLMRKSLRKLRRDNYLLQASMHILLFKRLMLSISTGVGLLMAVSLGTLGIDQIIAHRLAKLSDIEQMISRQQEALGKLRKRTWGVELVDSPEGRFIVLPAGMTLEKNWTVNNEEKIAMKIKGEN